MAKTYQISFTPTPGSYGTLVEYRESTSGTWITPAAPANPTTLSNYYLSLDEGLTYYVRLSAEGLNCTKEYKLIIITVPEGDNCCPFDYILSPDETYCYKVIEVPADPPAGTPDTLVAKTFASYTTCGSYIYAPGYLSNGTGTSTQISTSNPFWINWNGVTPCANNNTTSGPLNRAGIWASTTTDNQDLGFSVCLNLDEDKTYYVGIGCDNYGIIKLDGNTIVSQDVAALDIEYPAAGALSSTFKIFHIYPVNITSGFHILELIGHNVSSAAALGVEIYDNTSVEIAAATSYDDLNLIFSSKDYVGDTVQIDTNSGYSCPEGYTLSSCEFPYTCVQILTTPIIPC